MIEDIIIVTNFACLIYVCGRTKVAGCNSQKAVKTDTFLDKFGKYIFV